MNSTQILILQKFKTGLVEFMDELINWMPGDSELLATRILINDQMPITELMSKFILYLIPLADQIKNKDENFFLDDPQVFGQVKDKNRVLSLKHLWLNPEFTDADKEKAWKWMAFFLKCCTMYSQHSN